MKNLTRREFLRLASAMGGATLFAGCHLFAEEPVVPEYIRGAPAADALETLTGLRNVYSVCGMCPGNCGIRCRVAQGTLVKIGGSPFHPAVTRTPLPFDTSLEEALAYGGSICAEGGAGIQTLYDPFRVIKPLKRVGKRGSGKWTAIPWEQAITEIVEGGDLFGEGAAQGLRALKGTAGAFQLLLGRSDWGATIFVKRWLSAFAGAVLVRNAEVLRQEDAAKAGDAVFGPGTGEVSAVYDRAACVISFGDAPLDSGVPLVATARRIADARSKAPSFLWAVVDPRLSTSASKSDLWVPVIPGKDRELALGIMRCFLEQHPDLLRMPRDLVESLVGDKSAAFYAESAGIPREALVRLADFLAQGGASSAVIPGHGIYAQPDGLETAKIILTLNAMVGARPGEAGLATNASPLFASAERELLSQTPLAKRETTTDPQALLVWQADPVYENPSWALPRLANTATLPLLVVVDRELTETAALADYVLPDTTYLERWDICQSPPSVTASGFGLRAPVVGVVNPRANDYLPIFPETKIAEDIFMLIGSRLGLDWCLPDEHGRIPTAWRFFHEHLDAVRNAMQLSGFAQADGAGDAARIVERGGLFVEKPVLRTVIEPRTVHVDSKPLKGSRLRSAPNNEELLLIAYTLPFYRSGRSVVNSWLLEVMPENRLLMNTEDARRRGVKQGDRIQLDAVVGDFSGQCTVHVIPGIRPGVAALARGFGHTQFGASAISLDNRSRSADKPRGAGVNPDAVTGGPGPIRVKVTKAL